jgi:hypothetical protein
MNSDDLIRAQRILRLTCEELAETLDVNAVSVLQWRSDVIPMPERHGERINALLAMPEAERERHIFRNKMKYRRGR